jgi:hypothetical protein
MIERGALYPELIVFPRKYLDTLRKIAVVGVELLVVALQYIV